MAHDMKGGWKVQQLGAVGEGGGGLVRLEQEMMRALCEVQEMKRVGRREGSHQLGRLLV